MDKADNPAKTIKSDGERQNQNVAVYDLTFYDKGLMIIIMSALFSIMFFFYSLFIEELKRVGLTILIITLIGDFMIYVFILFYEDVSTSNRYKISNMKHCCRNTRLSGRYYCQCGKVVVTSL